MAKKKEAVKMVAHHPGEKRHWLFCKTQSYHPRLRTTPYEPDC